MAEVAFHDVTKVWPDGTRALTNVSLTVASGEFMVLVGPSGCGKSTLLRCLAGLEDPTSGTVSIDGSIVNEWEPRRRDVAMVFQNYALYPHMTVEKNLGFPLRMRRFDRAAIKKKVADVADLLGLTPLLHRKPKALSGGQMQRVALGRALVRDPAVFLFDEPLSNVDAKLRAEMRAELKALHRRLGTTMIYVTHDQVEAMTLGHRIAVLDQGTLKQVGPPLQVFNAPANQFVAGFLGSPPMNLVTGAEVTFLRPTSANEVLGFRPEHAQLAPGDTGVVELVELLGTQALVHVRLGEQRVAALVPVEATVEVGDRVALVVASEHLHVFDGASGERRP